MSFLSMRDYVKENLYIIQMTNFLLWLFGKYILQHFPKKWCVPTVLSSIEGTNVHNFRNIKEKVFIQNVPKCAWCDEIFLEETMLERSYFLHCNSMLLLVA